MTPIEKSYFWVNLFVILRTTTSQIEHTLDSQSDLSNSVNSKCLKPRGQFPASTCQNFINCWDGIAIEQSCPDGLLFNPTSLYCDHPHNVKCDSASTQNSLQPHSSPGNPSYNNVLEQNILDDPLNKFCLKQVGIFPGSSCGNFVHCWGGNVIELKCPDGLHFSKFGFCDYPANVGCENDDSPERNVPKKNICPQENGLFRNETFCDWYFVCTFGRVLAQYQCPQGFSYSEILGVCDYSYRVDCGNIPSANPQPPETTSNPNKHQKESDQRCWTVPDGPVRDSLNCSQYHLCDSGRVVATYICPEGTLFNTILGICDFSNKVDCKNSNKTKTDESAGPDLSPELLAAVEKCIPGTTIRLNADCSKACRCRESSAEIIQCTHGLAYDSTSDKCIPAHIAKC